MATYKVIQDIEAEDRLVGPLTLKGFIYAAVAALIGFINVRIVMATSLGSARWPIIIMLLLPMILFAVLALPLGREQPTETWLLSYLRFFLKPRKRIWNQNGIINLVTVTAPKRDERKLAKDLSQTEVKSRLKALAMTLDSHGWAVKNVTVNLSASPSYLDETDDRLVSTAAMQRDTPAPGIKASDDIMDEKANPTAKHFETLMEEAESERKAGLKARVQTAAKSTTDDVDLQFLYENSGAGPDGEAVSPAVIRPTGKENPQDDPYMKKRLRVAEAEFGLSHKNKVGKPPLKSPVQQRSTDPGHADKLNLAQNGSAFRVSTLSQMANRQARIKQISPGEVEIDLH